MLRSRFSIDMSKGKMGSVIRKPASCIFHEKHNKDADQLRSNCTAAQSLCFRYTEKTIPLHPKSINQASNHLLRLYSSVCIGLSKKENDQRFCHDAAHLSIMYFSCAVALVSDLAPWSVRGTLSPSPYSQVLSR